MSDCLDRTGRIARLRELPGGPELLELAASTGEMELVGGAVRDLLLARTPRELDVVVAGDVLAPAQSLAQRLGAQVSLNPRFGTALVQCERARIDLTMRRAESYPAPGALPQVRPGDRDQDLARRDFTVNAISMTLAGPAAGELHSHERAFEDLQGRILRVLHERSFIEDPTRMLRLARYSARLDLRVEEHTAELAEQALAAGAIQTLSGARVGAELRLALAEPDALAVFATLQASGVLWAVHPRLRYEEQLVRDALALLPEDGAPELLVLASLMIPLALRAGGDPAAEILSLLDRLEFPRAERDLLARATLAAPTLLQEFQGAGRDSQLYTAASEVPAEGVALAGGLGASMGTQEGAAVAAAAQRWLSEVRHVHLQIGGDELLAAGVPSGPEVGRRLAAALGMRLDGELAPGPAAELQAAIEAEI